MKKVSFGSFPLNNIRQDDRKCLDKYLIKTFADNISISDAIRNLGITKNLMYITPDTLMRDWLSQGKDKSHTNAPDRTGANLYDQTLKRAFYILKEFYKKIQHSPFYKEYVYYPIYVEKIDRVDVKGAGKSGAHTEVQMNYSFVILSNDLTKQLKIDEIQFDDNASLNFLFLFVEFFSGGAFQKSIHDYDKADHEFLIKLYQFIEESGKDPIHMVMDLYKLMELVKEAVDGPSKNSRLTIGQKSNSLSDSFASGNLRKYKGMIKHKLMDLLSKNGGGDAKMYREAFMDIVKAVLKSEGLSGLYDGIDSTDLGERYAYVYNSNKYREILNLSKELVDYNKLGKRDIISNDQMDFNFSVEHSNYTVDTNRHIAAQRYQTFFKSYVESISEYIKGIVTVIMEQLKIDEDVRGVYQQAIDTENGKIQNLQSRVIDIEAKLSASTVRENTHAQMADVHRQSGTKEDLDNMQDSLKLMNAEQELQRTLTTEIHNIDNEIKQLKMINTINSQAVKEVSTQINTTSSSIYKDIQNSVLSSMANDLTFIFDDGKKIFTNQLVAEGVVKTLDDPSYSPVSFVGFENTVNKFMDKGIFPPTITENGKEIPNPQFYMAQVIKSLQDGFDVMSDDVIDAISDAILPAVQKVVVSQPHNGRPNVQQEILDKVLDRVQAGNFIPSDLINRLRKEVFRNRFINKVIKPISKLFSVREIDSVIAFDKSISELHPLIRKLLSGGSRGQYFKSFVINYETCEQLYKTKFISDTQKFLAGLSKTPPRKLSSPMNRLQEVLFNYLGLKNNPVWVLSKTDVYLSMPDSLSLTNTSILSKIPKTELMDVCKIKASDYWNENNMAKVSSFGNPKMKALEKEQQKIRDNIKKLEKKPKNENKDNKERREKDLIKERKKLDMVEEKMNKAKLDDKQFTPNAFLFAVDDDTAKAENTPLLSDGEKADLERAKSNIQSSIAKLNPWDEEEQNIMSANVENQTQRTLPFDLEAQDEERDIINNLKAEAEKEDRAYEEFQRIRDESQNNRDR